ncbi:MAG: LacI family DNA-binding transcriptional regulator [Candidatus Acidiferrum sp.]
MFDNRRVTEFSTRERVLVLADSNVSAKREAPPLPPVRMKELADDLGLSIASVSRAFRNNREISSVTRARVLKRAAELNYRPNLAARALVTGRTSLMGLIVPDLVHSFFAELALGLSSVLRQSGFGLVVSSSEEDPELERQEIERLRTRGVDALLIASVQNSTDAFRSLAEQSVPYVLLDRWFSGLSANFVGVNDEKVGAIATEHLIHIGCQRIAHIRGTNVSTARGRLDGYTRTLMEHGIGIRDDYIVSAKCLDKSASAEGYAAAEKLLTVNPRPDGVFCCNDPVAIGAMRAILDVGLRIPEDIALIGAGNLRFDDDLQVPLSSVDQRSKILGERAAQLAMRIVGAHGQVRPKAIVLEPSLIVRKSTERVVPSLNEPPATDKS